MGMHITEGKKIAIFNNVNKSYNRDYSIITSIAILEKRRMFLKFSTSSVILLGLHGKSFIPSLVFLIDIYCCWYFGVLWHAPDSCLLVVGSGNLS